MKEYTLSVVINEKKKRVKVIERMFGAKNPKTGEHFVCMTYHENDRRRDIRVICGAEDVEGLIVGIREGKTADLSGYRISQM